MARLELVAAIKEAKAPRARASARTVPVPAPLGDEDRKDHFITRNGLTFAGSHLIIDLWEAEGLDDRDLIEQALIDAVNAAGATLLHIHLHTFTEGGGISLEGEGFPIGVVQYGADVPVHRLPVTDVESVVVGTAD